jgi:predicted transcriptional regulator
MSEPATPQRDPEAVSRFIERFAAMMVEAGVPRMPARIFVALLSSDSGRRTAAELGELLHVSPAGISGAVRYLVQLNLVVREREPGSRRDHYRVHDDAWYESAVRREQLLARWTVGVREGVAALGPDTPAGARLTETLAFFEFLEREMPALLARWHEHRAALRAHNVGMSAVEIPDPRPPRPDPEPQPDPAPHPEPEPID